MNSSTLKIARLEAIDDFRACEELQRAAWGMDAGDVVPLHLLVTFQKNGGLVLGAFDADGTMVGTLFGFLGVEDDAPDRLKHCSHMRAFKHCSHMMGVRPDWRGRGVGYRLKLAQREHALAQGLDRVTWTFDPLESLNASLNVRKLGAVCRTYIRDLYGAMSDERNAGLGSDRFRLDWWIGTRHVAERLAGAEPRGSHDRPAGRDAVVVNPTNVGPDGRRRPPATAAAPTAPLARVEIPADIQAMKGADLALARAWRAHVRELFEAAFAAGYTVVDFVSEVSTTGERRSFYVLQQGFEVTK